MTTLLFPGRHLINTAFQADYLRQIVQVPLAELPFLDGPAPPAAPPVDHIIFAVTSANQQHSRYNPIPFHVRAIGVDRFARAFEMAFGVRYRIIGVPHYRPNPRFAEFTLKEIREQTEGNLQLTPANCIVLCSTPAVIALYQALGFAVLPAELGHPAAPQPPVDVVRHFVAAGEGWLTDRLLREQLAEATFDLWQDFPDVPRRILRIWREPLLNDAGSLTDSRDYASYAYGMSNNSIIQLKYDDVKEALVPGKIVDEGCADGALLALISRDFPDSDLIGIEITGEFMARCLERQRAGDFGGSYVHFHQRNITHPIFEDGSIDTTLCNSTVHELWSYGDGAATVHAYLARKFAQTARGGRLIIRDVTGPEEPDRLVYLWLNDADGHADDVFAAQPDAQALERHLAGLSTFGRFLRFARDFRAAHRPADRTAAFDYRIDSVDGRRYAVLRLQDACEFISKMAYIDNWESEMHEAFAFWSFSDWKAALAQAGFRIVEDPNAPLTGSRAYLNPWLMENRYAGKVALFTPTGDGGLEPLPFPPSNVVVVGEKAVAS